MEMMMMTFHLRLKISARQNTRVKFDLEKLKDPNMLETFQAMIGWRFAPLTIMSNEDTDIDSMITTFNTAVTETASEIIGKHRQKKKKTWVTAEILDLCDERRELRKIRFEPEESEKSKKVNNRIIGDTKKYNISANLIRVIKNLHGRVTSAVLSNRSIGDWFQTTVGV